MSFIEPVMAMGAPLAGGIDADVAGGLSSPISMPSGGGGLSPLAMGSSAASTTAGVAGQMLQGLMGFVSEEQQAKQAQKAAVQASQLSGINADARLLQGRATVGRAATLAAASGGGLGGTTTGVLNQIAEHAMFNARAMAYRGITESDADLYMSKIHKDEAINNLIGGVTGSVGQTVTGALNAGFREDILQSKAFQSGEVDPIALSYLG